MLFFWLDRLQLGYTMYNKQCFYTKDAKSVLISSLFKSKMRLVLELVVILKPKLSIKEHRYIKRKSCPNLYMTLCSRLYRKGKLFPLLRGKFKLGDGNVVCYCQ